MTFLELNHVRKAFGDVAAVHDFSLAAERGEFVSFLGPSGCGKTTTLRMIAGFEKPTSGAITINDVDMTYRPPNQRNVGMVFQSYALFPNMTIAQNVGYGLKVRKKPKADIERRVGELLELIKLPDKGTRYPYQLSGGQQQRVALARALAIEPQVLLLDEPLSALDAKIRIALRKEIRDIQRQLGITTVYVTHDQEEALSLSDRVVVMSEGRIEQIGTPADIYNFPATPFVASFVGTLNLRRGARRGSEARAGLSVDGQEVRTAKPVTEARDGSTVTLAIRPESIELGEGGGSNRFKGTVEDDSFLGSIVRIRVRIGDQATISLDTFNDPHLTPPRVGESGHDLLPAGGRPRRGRRGNARKSTSSRRRDGAPALTRSSTGSISSSSTRTAPCSISMRCGAAGRSSSARRLDGATRRPVAGDVFATIGFDPSTGRVRAGAPLAIATMAEIREIVAAVIRRWCPSVAAARRAVDGGLVRARPGGHREAARPTCPPCSPRSDRAVGRSPSQRPTIGRRPTPRLRALGVRDAVAALACGDDGVGVKPDPRMLRAICEAVRVEPARTAVRGRLARRPRDGPRRGRQDGHRGPLGHRRRGRSRARGGPPAALRRAPPDGLIAAVRANSIRTAPCPTAASALVPMGYRSGARAHLPLAGERTALVEVRANQPPGALRRPMASAQRRRPIAPQQAPAIDRSSRADALRRFAAEVSGRHDLEALFRDVIDESFTLFGVDEAGLWMYDGSPTPLKLAAQRGLSPRSPRDHRDAASGCPDGRHEGDAGASGPGHARRPRPDPARRGGDLSPCRHPDDLLRPDRVPRRATRPAGPLPPQRLRLDGGGNGARPGVCRPPRHGHQQRAPGHVDANPRGSPSRDLRARGEAEPPAGCARDRPDDRRRDAPADRLRHDPRLPRRSGHGLVRADRVPGQRRARHPNRTSPAFGSGSVRASPDGWPNTAKRSASAMPSTTLESSPSSRPASRRRPSSCR